MEWDSLLALCGLHSTPGDEDEVAGFLGRSWRRYGLAPEGLGRYALVARRAAASPGAPRVLVCAHMDSPGYVVQCVQRGRRRGVAVALGGPAWPDDERPQTAVVKTAAGAGACILRQDDFNRSRVTVTADVELTRGDRICFPPQGQVRRGRVQASFLDNRIGCHVLTRLAGALPAPAVELLLAATASEEFGGFGAAVLATKRHLIHRIGHASIPLLFPVGLVLVGLVLRGVDDRVLVVVEQPEEPVQPHVHAGGLDHHRVPGVEHDPAGVDLGADVAVGEQHAATVVGARQPRVSGRVRRWGMLSTRPGRPRVEPLRA